MNSFVEFYWKVPEAGFEWLATKGFPSRQMDAGVEGSYLVDRMKWGVPGTVRNYPAFQETGLFRRFAATEPVKDAIVEFANAYGFLGGEVTIPVQIPVGERGQYLQPRERRNAGGLGRGDHGDAAHDRSVGGGPRGRRRGAGRVHPLEGQSG